jgi:hypothetical protein
MISTILIKLECFDLFFTFLSAFIHASVSYLRDTLTNIFNFIKTNIFIKFELMQHIIIV